LFKRIHLFHCIKLCLYILREEVKNGFKILEEKLDASISQREERAKALENRCSQP